jgi:hypothetical protein
MVSPSATDIRGIVRGDDGKPVVGARVNAIGPVNVSATTDATGSYDLQVPPGVYRVTVAMNGFETAIRSSLTVASGGVVANVSLASPENSRYKTIGRTETTAERSQFNTSPAAVQTLTVQDIDNQGRSNNLGKMLDEIPGVSTVTGGGSYYTGLGLTDAGWLNPQIRGSFAYESAQSYDGFPLLTADPSSGFNAGLMTTLGLGGIDVIKGPGADSPTINAAVGGSINYRSLDPTAKPKFSADAGTDGLGGSTWKATATGSLLNNRLGYVLAYSASNGPGIFSARGGARPVQRPTYDQLQRTDVSVPRLLRHVRQQHLPRCNDYDPHESDVLFLRDAVCLLLPLAVEPDRSLGGVRQAGLPSYSRG